MISTVEKMENVLEELKQQIAHAYAKADEKEKEFEKKIKEIENQFVKFSVRPRIDIVNTCVIIQIGRELYFALSEQKTQSGNKCFLFSETITTKEAKEKLTQMAIRNVYKESCRLFEFTPDVMEKRALKNGFKEEESGVVHHIFTIVIKADKLDKFINTRYVSNKRVLKGISDVCNIRLINTKLFTSTNIRKNGEKFFDDINGKKCQMDMHALNHAMWFVSDNKFNNTKQQEFIKNMLPVKVSENNKNSLWTFTTRSK